MYPIKILSFFLFLTFVSVYSIAQQTGSSSGKGNKNTGIYDYSEAFAGSIYTQSGNAYRSVSGKPGHAYWQNRADYKIQVSLNEKLKTITGSEIITYTNNSPDDLEFIWLQLDQNLYKKNSRGLAIVPLGGSRSGVKGQIFDGGYKIKSAKLLSDNGKEMELNCMIDDTRMQLLLPEALKSKAKLKLKVEFSFIIPEYGSDRMGILETTNGSIFSLGQWYPRLCVYDDISGWNTIPYTGPAEFYLEYGNFDIAITVPANHMVACSGQLVNPDKVFTPDQLKLWNEAAESEKTVMIRSERDARNAIKPTEETRTWEFRMENSRDVAWASSSAFMIDAARINLPDGKVALAVSAYPAESSGKFAWGRSTQYIKASVEYYSAKLMEYPYPVALNVASNVGGMEYPGIVFCSSKARTSALWAVTDHEFGHTWFPMIVGSNERLYPWMDEGLNTFINEFSATSFNGAEYDKGPQNRRKWISLITDSSFEPVVNSADNIKEKNITYLSYYKPAIALFMLRDYVLGPERFDRAFKLYVDRWAYKHPTPDDFFRTIENSSGENLNWFWRGWFLNNWELDQGITGVSYVKNDPAKGILITVVNLNKMVMPAVVEITTKSGTVSRVQLPVEIWQRDASWTFQYPSTEEIATVKVDPDEAYPDINTDNNTWQVKN